MMYLTLCIYTVYYFLIMRALYINKISCLLSQGGIVTPVPTSFGGPTEIETEIETETVETAERLPSLLRL